MAAVMSLALLTAAFTNSTIFLYLCTVLLGATFGGFFTLCPAIVSEWWGSSCFGRSWRWTLVAVSTGGSVFNSLFGLFYDYRGGVECIDRSECYRPALLSISLIISLCSVLIIILSKLRRE